MDKGIFEHLAALLSYPDEHPQGSSFGGAAGSELASFADAVRPLSLHERQELFIQTFDLTPVCSLEVGWHLFGENYDRGLLLVKMRQQLRAHGISETTELPDHLTNGLRLLARMERDDGAYFAEAIVLPALAKMLEAIQGKDNPYEHVLAAAQCTVREHFPEIPARLEIPAGVPELRVLA